MKAASFRSKFILRVFGVQNLFCEELECKIYFAKAKIDNVPFFGNAPDGGQIKWWASSFRRWASKRTYPPYIDR
ncbi:MAG: hypothetical protein DRR16_31980 [Candidatus Parabeggiatoa sp. nov. 3]|nr:MAG: hypothetical protein DRR00_08305 [Gammaproteobacteria bacterium]RKZ67908.1 MAG: hypothetical protein DRQ99_05390 [Gammaproteobacteria bacterium]RKZ74620.1 MAG: hypothetical protein DRR16_31980 [Gammaproteobacteria bacterium]